MKTMPLPGGRFARLLLLVCVLSAMLGAGRGEELFYEAPGPIAALDFSGPDKFYLHFATSDVPLDGSRVSHFGQRRVQAWSGVRELSTLRTPILVSDLPNGTLRFARDDSHFIYDGSGGLVRRAFYSTPAQAQILTTFTGEGTPDGGGAMLAAGGRVFWGEYSQNGYEIFSHTTALGGLNASHGRINVFTGTRSHHRLKKMMAYDSGSSLALTEGGDLFVFSHAPGGTLKPVASNLVDFTWRNERTGAGVLIKQPRVYGITGASTAGNPPGEVRRYNPILITAGNGTLLFTAPVVNGLGYRFTEIEADDDRVFLRRVPVVNSLFGPVPDTANITTWRAVADSNEPPPAAPWAFTSVPVNGNLLRSDGRWLYFARDGRIFREPASIEPVALDFGMVGVEITQMLQSLDHARPLQCGKRTFVRAYASEIVNRGTGLSGFQPNAKLRVFRRRPFGLSGALLPEEELTAALRLLNLPTLRPEVASRLWGLRSRMENGYLWELPTDWVAAAAEVRVEVEVNADRALPELADPTRPEFNSYANNKAVSGIVKLERFPTDPVLVFVPMRTQGASFFGRDIGSFNFSPFTERAKSMMPVRRFHTYARHSTFVPGIAGGTFTFSDGGQSALGDLAFCNTFWADPDGCDIAYFVGVVHPDWPGNFNGIGFRPGNTSIVALRRQLYNKSDGLPAFQDFNLPVGGRTLAHELGHNFGLPHVHFPNSGPGQPDGPYASYPYPLNAFGSDSPDPNGVDIRFGFDPITHTALPPSAAADLMSYGQDRWTSEFTYEWLANGLFFDEGMLATDLYSFLPFGAARTPTEQRSAKSTPVRRTTSGAGSYFVVQGTYDAVTREASLRPVWKVPAATLPETAITRSETAAAAITAPVALIRQLGANGAVLRTTPAVLQGAEGADAFTQIIAAEPGAARVEVVEAATTQALAAHAASPNAPVVTAGAVDLSLANNRLRWSWTASDADGGPLFFVVHYITPAGRQEILGNFTRDLAIELDPRHLPGAEGARLRVLACDGFHTTVAESAPFTIPLHEPEIQWGDLIEGETIPFGSARVIALSASDAEQGTLPPTALSWIIHGTESHPGAGESVPLAGLRPGAYGLDAGAVDRDGLSAAGTRTFTIAPALIPEAAAAVPVLDGFADEAYTGALVLPIALPDGSQATARFVHHGGKLFGVLSGFPAQDNTTPTAAPPGIAGIRVDLDGNGSATPENDSLTFEVDEAGTKLFWHTAPGHWVRADAPPSGFEAVTSFGDASWNVEFSLTEDHLGGWNHLIGLSAHYTPNGGGSFSAWPVSAATSAVPAAWGKVWLGAAPPVENIPPVAVAGGDRTENPRALSSIGLDGTASHDANGDLLTYAWTQTGGPPVTLHDSASPLPFFTHGPVSVPVTYSFRLVVNDGAATSAPAEISVTLAPAPAQTPWPAPDARPDEIERLPGGTLRLNLSTHPLRTADPGDSFASTIGRLYTVETSEDLLTWQPLRREPADWTGRLEFTHTPATGETRRFYRLRR